MIYRLRDGPLLVDVFVAMLERKWLKQAIFEFDCYWHYMDNIFYVTGANPNIEIILEELNGAHSAIGFTVEQEVDNTVAFRDVSLKCREDGSVYRKRTCNDQYTHFISFVPLR